MRIGIWQDGDLEGEGLGALRILIPQESEGCAHLEAVWKKFKSDMSILGASEDRNRIYLVLDMHGIELRKLRRSTILVDVKNGDRDEDGECQHRDVFFIGLARHGNVPR